MTALHPCSRAARWLSLLLLVGLAACSVPGVPDGGPSADPSSADDIDATWLAEVSERIDNAQFAPHALGEHVLLPNPAHKLRLAVGPETEVHHTSTGDALAIELVSLGRPDAPEGLQLRPQLGAPRLGDCATPERLDPQGGCVRRVEQDARGFVAWWQSAPDGIRQGWTLSDRPAGDEPIAITVSLSGLPVESLDDGATFAAGSETVSYAGIKAWDADGAALAATLSFESQSDRVLARLSVDDAGAAWPITVDPILSTAVWSRDGAQSGMRLGEAMAAAGDLNGDGYGDVAIAARDYNANSTIDTGLVEVFYGSATGLASTPDVTIEGDLYRRRLGASVDMAGDIDGDGFGDLVIGAEGYGGSGNVAGRVYVHYGSAAGVSSMPDLSLTSPSTSASDDLYGSSVAGVGDVNSDGYSDVLVGAPYCEGPAGTDVGCAYLYLGAVGGLATAPTWTISGSDGNVRFGTSVDGAGDVNGDGAADWIVGAPDYSNNAGGGYATVFYGPGGTSSVQLTGSSGTRYGESVSGAGDVDGDGYADVIVGAPRASCISGGTWCGRARVYLGTSSGLSTPAAWEADGNDTYTNFGASVSSAGDLNGDGLGDFVVGRPSRNNSTGLGEKVHVFYGDSSSNFGSDTLGDVLAGATTGGRFGSVVSGAGDVNGDGLSDLLAAETYYSSTISNGGQVRLYSGSRGGLGDAEDWTIESNQAQAGDGMVIAYGGDLNGDGYDEVLLGIPSFDTGFGADAGRTYVFLGTEEGLALSAALQISGGEANEQSGASVAGLGDVNGDGYGDIAVGSPLRGSTDWGRVRVYHGSAGTLDATDDALVFGGSGDMMGASVASAGDVNGDGYADMIVGSPGYGAGQSDEGQAQVFLGSATGIGTTAAWSFEPDQSNAEAGTVVGTAGDVNGDGYFDVFVGAPLYDAGADTDAGAVWVFHGASTGPSATDDAEIVGALSSSLLGTSAASAGDVNGDGIGELIVGAPGNLSGTAALYLGSVGGLQSTAFRSWSGTGTLSAFGSSVAGGDLNGDGFSDCVVGAPLGLTGVGLDEGEVHVFYGGQSMGLVADLVRGSGQIGAQLGGSIAVADTNGDGVDDLLAVARFLDAGQTDEGRAEVILGNTVDSEGKGLGLAPRAVSSSTGTGSVALMGAVPDVDEVTVRGLLRSAAGRGDVALEVEVVGIGDPFSGVKKITSAYVDSGTDGVDAWTTVGTLTEGTSHHWRARLRTSLTDATEITAGPWIYGGLPGDPSGTHVRTACVNDADGDGICDAFDFDNDGDGFTTPADCDDTDPAINPMATEIPDDGIDQDCNGWDAITCYDDNDFDTWGGASTVVASGVCIAGQVSTGGDCDDNNALANPDELEVCDGFDNDCDTDIDDADNDVSGQGTWYEDTDSDQYGDPGATQMACFQPAGWVGNSGDCDDTDANINPAASETCDGVDENCDGVIPPDELDTDGDGISDCDGDCDDGNPATYPGATELCDGEDNDCNGVVPPTELDGDGDSFSTCAGDCDDGNPTVYPNAAELCDGLDTDCDLSLPADEADADADGSRVCDGDCDDSDDTVYPGAPEICDGGVDNDCNPSTVEGADLDNDSVDTCTDCDDNDSNVKPGAAEICDGKDSDCDGSLPLNEQDVDEDDVVACVFAVIANPPAGLADDDCDDGDESIYPGAPELCDGLDNDCDGSFPPGETDGDGDGFLPCDSDCDDGEATVYPGAPELCDGLDNDCNGSIPSNEADADSDGVSLCDGDCADSNPLRFPGNPEVCDGVDNDCDGVIPPTELDDDGDGESECAGDCDDGNITVWSGATEICDLLDTDCDGVIPVDETDPDGDFETACQGDCEPTNFLVNTFVPEICDMLDNNCSGSIDEGFDSDGDGYVDGTVNDCALNYPSVDCDDTDDEVNPGAPEVCDGADNNCDGTVDEGFDSDGDGDLSAALCAGGTDCDDSNPAVFSGATEVCDGADNDCDSTVDEGFDADGDGFFDGANSGCVAGYPVTDCDDADAATFPGASELCDGQDNDCDGSLWALETDGDGDGYVECATPTHLPGFGGDCDDTNSAISPVGVEICNGLDEDCDGSADEDFDTDSDGFYGGTLGCEATYGANADCDDTDVTINPGAAEVCDGADQNCDGVIDDGFDTDGDGVTSCGGDCDDTDAAVLPGQSEVCGNGIDDDCDGTIDVDADADGDGFGTCAGDCDDADPLVNPGATEACDGIDNNCNGVIDDGFDGDGDGSASCVDCDDTDPNSYPLAPELCDGVDNDCDGLVDELFDVDGDGVSSCGGDCDDSNATVNPTAVELCDGIDNNCDGLTDETFDLDMDGAFDGTDPGCAAVYGVHADCDDNAPAVYPGAVEVCDGLDGDCEGSVPADEFDADGDGYVGCSNPEPNHIGSPTGGNDCDDADPGINPGATELCDGLDNDCSGLPDEQWDTDFDGYADGNDLACQGVAFDTDCDDSETGVFPGAAEVCNALDDNCDGSIDEDFDTDGDGYYDGENGDCAAAWAGSGTPLDCDDADPAVFPFNVEDCANGIDDNCDGQIDEDEDLDGDGFSTCAGDCDDADPAIYAGAPELCNGRDDDCDFATDEDFDLDGDGAFAGGGCLAAWGVLDCNDANEEIFPGAQEECNGTDDDCEGGIDEPFDLDLDGYYRITADCGETYGLALLDCDDNEAAANPDTAEDCVDGIDNDCDLMIDGDDPDCAGDDDDSGDDDDDDDDDDDGAQDDDDSGDDDDSAEAPWVYPGCTCATSEDRSGLWMLLPLLLVLRRRRPSRLA